MEANDLKNLVFFIVAIAAWAIQAALKRKQESDGREEARERRKQRSGEAPTEIEEMADEPDVIFGRRQLPAHYTDQVRPKPPPVPKRNVSAPPPVSAKAAASATREALRTGGEIHLGRLEDRKLESRLTATAAATVKRDPSGVNARKRLGISAMGGRRRAIRTALLWGEVLGPPLALRGPHRWKPPATR